MLLVKIASIWLYFVAVNVQVFKIVPILYCILDSQELWLCCLAFTLKVGQSCLDSFFLSNWSNSSHAVFGLEKNFIFIL